MIQDVDQTDAIEIMQGRSLSGSKYQMKRSESVRYSTRSGESLRGSVKFQSRDFISYQSEEGFHLHLWAVSEPFRGSSLIIAPKYAGGSVTGLLRLRNARGECFNECSIASRGDQAVTLDLDAFLECCEMDCGFMHAHLEIVTDHLCTAQVQVSTSTRSVLMGPLHSLSDVVARAFPLTFSPNIKHVIAMTNTAERQVSLRCRMYLDSRSPEEACLIPPKGVVLLSPQVLFQPIFGDLALSEEAVGYLRFSTRSSEPIGLQLLEEVIFPSGERVLGVVE